MTNTIVTRDIIAKEIIANLDKTKQFLAVANEKFDGIIKGNGTDTVVVQQLPSISMDIGGDLGGDIAVSDWAISEHSLVIDQAGQKALKVKDIEEVRTNFNLKTQLGARMGEGYKNMKDQFTALTAVRGVASTSRLNDNAPVTLTKTDVVTKINEVAQTLEEHNVDLTDGSTVLFINPAIKNLINSSDLNTGFDKGYASRIKGTVGEVGGLVCVKTNNLPFKQKVEITGVPTANDTITIDGVVFTAKASASAAGDVAIGASAAEFQSNLSAAINGTGTPGATTYIELSTADRKTLKDKFIKISSFATNVASLTSAKYIATSEAMDNVTLGTASRVMVAIQQNAVNIASQMTKFKTTESNDGFSGKILYESAFGGAVLGDNQYRICTVDITNGTTVA